MWPELEQCIPVVEEARGGGQVAPRGEWAVIPIRVGMIGARESKFFHHLSIILTCKNSLFTCKNYCKMVKDVHETGKLCSM